jgi:cbb3-type cytochrome oxidase subunit 3
MPERRLPLSAWELAVCWLGGAIAWLVHLLGAYALAEFGCVAGWQRLAPLGVTAVAWGILVLSVGTVAVSAWAFSVASRADKRLTRVSDPTRTRHFAARSGMWLNGFFVAVIVAETVPVLFYLGRCG